MPEERFLKPLVEEVDMNGRKALLTILGCAAMLIGGCGMREGAPMPVSSEAPPAAPARSAAARPAGMPPSPPLVETLEKTAELRGGVVRSPKSAAFSPDGSRLYVNALEGMHTIVYDAATLERLALIRHSFGPADAGLFPDGETMPFDYRINGRAPGDAPNCFGGKPVEMAFSHGGRFLWVPYYRRTWDLNASSPSAAAVIDTASNAIVRVIPTGPLPKMIVPSPDGRRMAVIHWGDNTAGIMDISSDNPSDFAWERLLVSGRRLDVRGISGDRDHNCGQCLRGAVFTPDGAHLLVGRMGGRGGITAFEVATGRMLGTLTSVPATPRHLALSPDGARLYVTSSRSGMVTELDMTELMDALQKADGGTTDACRGRSLRVGETPRTLAVSPDGARLYVSCNLRSELVVVDVARWKVTARRPVAPHAVGLALGPDERVVATTSQGRGGRGGDVLTIFRMRGSDDPRQDRRTRP